MRPNVFADRPWDFEAEAARIRGRGVGEAAGARELGATVYELAPGASDFFLGARSADEELFVVLSGRPTLRTKDSERELAPGDVVACRSRRNGTDTIANFTGEATRLLAVSMPRLRERA